MSRIILFTENGTRILLDVDDTNRANSIRDLSLAIGRDKIIDLNDSWFTKGIMEGMVVHSINLKSVVAVCTS